MGFFNDDPPQPPKFDPFEDFKILGQGAKVGQLLVAPLLSVLKRIGRPSPNIPPPGGLPPGIAGQQAAPHNQGSEVFVGVPNRTPPPQG
jgi:hypothetical protein